MLKEILTVVLLVLQIYQICDKDEIKKEGFLAMFLTSFFYRLFESLTS